MSAGVEVSVDARALERALRDGTRRAIGTLAPTMAIVAESLVSAVNDEFATAGHGAWPPLAESTLARRRGSSAQILLDTGRFAASIRADSGPTFAEAATDVSYAVYHVSDEPRSKIPLRNPFDVTVDVLDRATETIVAALAEALVSR